MRDTLPRVALRRAADGSARAPQPLQQHRPYRTCLDDIRRMAAPMRLRDVLPVGTAGSGRVHRAMAGGTRGGVQC